MSGFGINSPGQIGPNVIQPFHHSDAWDKWVDEPFNALPVAYPLAGYGTPSGTAGTVNYLQTPHGIYSYTALGTQTIVAPVYTAGSGLDIGMDQTNNDGVQVHFNAGLHADGRQAFTIGGSHRRFFVEITINPQQVAGTDNLYFGLFKNQALQSALASYTDFFVMGIDTAVASGSDADIKIKTNLNNGGVGTTDTGLDWVDAVARKFTIAVDSSGKVTPYIDDSDSFTKPATQFTFDNGDVVVPRVFFLHDTAVVGTLYLSSYRGGYARPNRGM